MYFSVSERNKVKQCNNKSMFLNVWLNVYIEFGGLLHRQLTTRSSTEWKLWFSVVQGLLFTAHFDNLLDKFIHKKRKNVGIFKQRQLWIIYIILSNSFYVKKKNLIFYFKKRKPTSHLLFIYNLLFRNHSKECIFGIQILVQNWARKMCLPSKPK